MQILRSLDHQPSPALVGLPLPAQVDEPALREGLPLKAAKWNTYLGWAVDAFRRVVWGEGC